MYYVHRSYVLFEELTMLAPVPTPAPVTAARLESREKPGCDIDEGRLGLPQKRTDTHAVDQGVRHHASAQRRRTVHVFGKVDCALDGVLNERLSGCATAVHQLVR